MIRQFDYLSIIYELFLDIVNSFIKTPMNVHNYSTIWTVVIALIMLLCF